MMELLATLAIVGIVAALAVPSLQGLIGRSEISAASNKLVYSLQTARSEAIKRIVPVTLCPSEDPLEIQPSCGGNLTNGWVVFVDSDGNGEKAATEEVILQSEALPLAISVGTGSVFNEAVLFGIEGTTVSTSGVPLTGTIAISHPGSDDDREVRIAASGRITSVVTRPASEISQ